MTSYFPASLERRCCWGWAELLSWGTCVHSKLQLELPQITHLKSISLPSPLLLQRWVLQGRGGAASKASPCVWSDEDLKSSSPAPALELITGPQVWEQGPESCRSAACSPLSVHSPSLIYPRASWLPAKDYCLALSCRLLVQAWCHCCQPPGSPLGHNLHSSSIFSLGKRRTMRRKEYSAPLSPAHLL